MSAFSDDDARVDGFDIGAPRVAVVPATIRLGTHEFSVRSVQVDAKGQDRLLVRDGFAAVADGSTPLDRRRGGEVGTFAERALDALERGRGGDPRSQFRAAITRVGAGRTDATTPTCGVGLVQTRGSNLEIVVIADVLVAIRHNNGTVTVVHDNRVGYFDARSAAAMSYLMTTHNHTPEEARAGIQPLIADQFQNHRNKSGGYWVFANNPAAANEISAIRVAADDVESVLVCSDGFTRLVDIFGADATIDDLMRRAETSSLDDMVADLRARENAADSMRAFPRTSQNDDVTAVVLQRRA